MIFMQVAGATVLSHPVFVEVVLPFLLVFTVVFAILQKTKVLGEGKKQIDAIVALVVGLIVISFGFATGIIVSLVPILAVGVVVILVFMLLYGMVYKEGDFDLHKGVKITIGAIAAVVVVIAVLVSTGGLNYLIEVFWYSGEGSGLLTNVVFIVVIIAAFLAVVLWNPKKD